MSMVDGVGVGGSAGSAHSSAVFMGGIVVCAGGVVGLLVAGVCLAVVGVVFGSILFRWHLSLSCRFLCS